MNTTRLNGPHSAGKPEDELLHRSIQPLLERWLDFTLEPDLFGEIRRDIEDSLNLPPRFVQDGEDHPQRLGESGGGVFIFFRESRQAAVPHRAARASEPTRRSRHQESCRKRQNQEGDRDDRRGHGAAVGRAGGKNQSTTRYQTAHDALS